MLQSSNKGNINNNNNNKIILSNSSLIAPSPATASLVANPQGAGVETPGGGQQKEASRLLPGD